MYILYDIINHLFVPTCTYTQYNYILLLTLYNVKPSIQFNSKPLNFKKIKNFVAYNIKNILRLTFKYNSNVNNGL